ncbi:hypothetical protein [Alkalibacillus silvisoli]|uniref:Uncharacterized protein n=1 Tax=Alkalibacillus silvisoli TaxID=392823 RepID=A0ABN1AAW3_9BACI
MDLTMSYKEAYELVNDHGYDSLIDHVSELFPNNVLYSCSTGWFMYGAKYICKLQGRYGDIVISWSDQDE